MNVRLHVNYARVLRQARDSHEQNRSPEGIEPQDVVLARLYSYAFRLHTIGAFHATRLAIGGRPSGGQVAEAYRLRAVEALEDLGNQSIAIIRALSGCWTALSGMLNTPMIPRSLSSGGGSAILWKTSPASAVFT